MIAGPTNSRSQKLKGPRNVWWPEKVSVYFAYTCSRESGGGERALDPGIKQPSQGRHAWRQNGATAFSKSNSTHDVIRNALREQTRTCAARRAAAWAATRFFRRSCPSEDAPAKKNGRPRLRAPRAPKELGSTAIRKSRLSLPGKRQPPSAVLLATEHWLSRRVVRVLRVLVVRGIKPGQVKPSQV